MDKPESMSPLISFEMWVSQQSPKLCNPLAEQWNVPRCNTAQAQHKGRWPFVLMQCGEVSILNQIKKLPLSTPGARVGNDCA